MDKSTADPAGIFVLRKTVFIIDRKAKLWKKYKLGGVPC